MLGEVGSCWVVLSAASAAAEGLVEKMRFRKDQDEERAFLDLKREDEGEYEEE